MTSSKKTLLALAFMVFVLPVAVFGAPGEVLILLSTVGPPSPSLEETVVIANGRTPVLCDNACWSAKTTAQFADYDALILGDPTCGGTPPSAAEGNVAVWSAAVTGKVTIWGTDPSWHSTFNAGDQGGNDVAEAGIAFALSDPNETGAYITTSCYYDGAAAGTPVPMLAGFGVFTASGGLCWNDAHIVAVHPALASLTDARLSNWSCSTHNYFDVWPGDFVPLVIAEGVPGGTYTAGDGTVGGVYVLTRGAAPVNTGACCDRNALVCTDSVFEADCQPPLVWYDSMVCDDVDPPCEPTAPVPAVSEWGILVLTLIGLIVGTTMFGRKQATA